MKKRVSSIKQTIIEGLDELSSRSQRELLTYLNYLKAREELEATKEILEDPQFVESIMRGDADFKAGRYKRWDKVKKDV